MRKIFVLFVATLQILACTLTNNVSAQNPVEHVEASKPAQVLPVTKSTCIVTAVETLNLRAAPGTYADVIAILKNGEVVTILYQSTQGNWIRIRAGIFDGWINSDYCERN